jgi:hypothetical protein
LEAVVTIVVPVFGIIGAGYLAGRRGLLGEASSEALNGFVYWIAMPVLLFRAIATIDPAISFNGPYIAAYLLAALATAGLAVFVARFGFRRDPAQATLFGMASIFANTGYMGIALFVVAFGPEGTLPAVVTTVVMAAIVIGGVDAALTALVDTRQKDGKVSGVVRALAGNPFLISAVLGFAWAFSGWALPAPVDTFCLLLGQAAGPGALFAIGLFLVGRSVRRDVGEVVTLCALKLIVHPLIAWVMLVHVFAVEPAWAIGGVVLAALPTGINPFVLAQRHGVYVERSSVAVVVSTLASVVTLSILLSAFGVGG